ncbi:MAG TPA: 16S rRNA (guanine(527)-N(7))-methyltransferase RsmG [Dongiaceae bacterium]|nr:16S rRNA (guanine(527)-N(7))-methyltransferase RsmG [Dongiaceae bacterium]
MAGLALNGAQPDTALASKRPTPIHRGALHNWLQNWQSKIYNQLSFMDPAHIAALLEPFLPGSQRLTGADLERISMYIDILLRWNARVNLTAIRDPEQIVTRHFGESLFTARHLFPNREDATAGAISQACGQHAVHPVTQLRVADVGSGAGFPGMPAKIWSPQIELTLIESNHKKAAFLREAARCLRLTDINVQIARAETLPAGSFDVVTLRAVECFESILPQAAELVAPSGRLALLIGSSQVTQTQTLLERSSFIQVQRSIPVIPIPRSTDRILAIVPRR